MNYLQALDAADAAEAKRRADLNKAMEDLAKMYNANTKLEKENAQMRELLHKLADGVQGWHHHESGDTTRGWCHQLDVYLRGQSGTVLLVDRDVALSLERYLKP